MQKYWLLMASITLSISMLTACNTSNDTNSGQENTTSEVEEGEQKESTPDEETEEQADTSSEETESEATTDTEEVIEERGTEKSLSYNKNGDTKEESATLTNSEEQNYSLYKLDGFELTGEEPNKDSLYLAENDAVFMRIETIPQEESSIDYVRENMRQTMQAVGISSTPSDITEDDKLPQGNGITSQAGSEVKTELGTVSGYVFEQGNLIVRLTIFDRNSANMTDAFLKMGETIAAKE